jgi:hypothetical protein
MPERGAVPAVLIDGPSAGRLIYVDPGVRAWNMVKPAEPLGVAAYFDLSQLWASTTLEFVTYRIEQYGVCTPCPSMVLGFAYFHLRVGWSDGDEPDEEALRRHGRRVLAEHPELMPAGAILWPADPADDEPIRILSQGDGPIPGCRDEFQMEPRTRLMRGICPACGWRTESVESRRFEELRALTAAHGRAGQQALTELIQQGLYSYADYAELMGILGWANRPHAAPDAVPETRREAATLDEVPTAFANWPEQGSTCAHICGADPDHQCQARATARLKYPLPSGGTRSMPLCDPCFESETAAKERADA